MRFAQLVIGPAGSGKSTYCSTIVKHAADKNQTIDVVNLDPAAEHFDYEPLVDIRKLIHVEDTMEDKDLQLGPNGGLVFCMETLLENIDWLETELGDADEDYILFDCPGQLELYTHLPVMAKLVEILKNWGFNICAVFMIDSTFILDGAKFISASMAALSVMCNLDLQHHNVLTKIDLLSKSARKQLDDYMCPDPELLLGNMRNSKTTWHKKHMKLTEAIGSVMMHYQLVNYVALNIKNEKSIDDLLYIIDLSLQRGEDDDVKVKDFEMDEVENVWS